MKKVLIIDDEVDLTKMLKISLEKIFKYSVFIENNGKNGLASAKKTVPDVILLDILMPGIDGFEVLSQLKQDAATVSIPVIILTAVITDDAKAEAAGLYNESYVEKPVSVEVLDEEIKKVLNRRTSK